MNSDRYLIVAGEGSGHDLVGFYVLTDAETEEAWSADYSDVWEYVNQKGIKSYDTFAELLSEVLRNQWSIKDTWVTPTY